MKRIVSLLVFAALIVAGCDSESVDPTTPGAADVSVNFKLLTPRSTKKSAQRTITGTNGTIELDDIRFIVAEFELEAENADCDGESLGDDDCAEFESEPFLFQLPLDVDEVTVAAGAIPLGTYDQFEFEIEDLESDDAEDLVPAQDLLTRIRDTEGFADWPDSASMIIVGEFTPQGSSTPEAFRVYAEAEVEIEITLSPPLVIDSETTDYSVNIYLSPEDWLENPDGTVIDLREFDFAATDGQLMGFEVEFEDGFREVEIED